MRSEEFPLTIPSSCLLSEFGHKGMDWMLWKEVPSIYLFLFRVLIACLSIHRMLGNIKESNHLKEGWSWEEKEMGKIVQAGLKRESELKNTRQKWLDMDEMSLMKVLSQQLNGRVDNAFKIVTQAL